MEAVDFELQVSDGSDRAYPVAAHSRAGEASAVMRLPWDEQELEGRFLALQLALSKSGARARRVPSTDERLVQDFGRELFDALLTGDVRSLFDATRSQVGDRDEHLRLVLRIRPPELAVLPFEFMYDARRDDYLCLAASVVRYSEAMEAVRPLAVAPPLRILGMVASPSDLVALDLEEEKRWLLAALDPLQRAGRVELEWVEGQTWRHLQRAMNRGEWHVLHFVGHGGFERRAREGFIALADEQGGTHRLSATKLGQLLGSRRSLRMVLLNACESARASAQDVFSSTATVLTRRGAPAVLAMQYEISDRAAIEFSRAFYEALADGLPVDEAVTSARVAVNIALDDSLEWGVPMLYLRSTDRRLFEVAGQPGREPGAGRRPSAGPVTRKSPSAPAVALRREPSETRKIVTVVSCDVVVSTRSGGRADPERLEPVMAEFQAAAKRIVERHGGMAEPVIGNSVVALFGVPLVHGDDALRAVRAALELRQAARPLNDGLGRRVGIRLETRTGVSTGEVIVASSARGHRLIGEAVNLAAGLQRLAGRQEIVLGEATAQLVWRVASLEPLPRSAGETTATAPRSEFRLLGLVPEGPAQARRLVAPSVGREAELHLLREAFQRAVSERSCHLFTVLGPAGIGKTRLVSDFARTVDTQAVVISGHCPSYGDGITFLPVAEAIRGLAGITGDDAPEVARERLVALLEGVPDAAGIVDRVAVALGLAELSTTAEGVNWSIQRLLEAAARRRPLVVVFDDVHWGEPTFLDLVELIVDWTQGTPMLVVCTGRWPELLQRRPSWGGGKPNATSILLGPLEPDQSQQLLGRLLGQDDLPEGLAAHVNAAAEGNPLFVEEMVAMLMDGGQLRREHGRWRLTVDVARIPLPPTIRVLLEARLDQLPHLQQVILERAAVVGKSFSPEAVAALSPTSERPGLMAQLLALAGKDLIRRGQGELAEQAAFAFRHQLIRDAAYRRQPERVRAELHERLGTWLESIASPGHTDWEELAAHHLEQACRYRANLGQVDAPLARRAANLLAAAGQRASDRWDHRAASSLLQRARSLPLDDDLFRLEVTPALVASLGYQGHMREAGDLASRGIELARKLGERRLEARVRIEQQLNAWSDAEQWSAEEALGEIERAIPLFRESGDDRGLAAAWLLTARIDNMLLRWAAMEAPLRRTILHSRHVGDQGRVLSGLNLLGLTFLYGPYPVPEAVRRLEEIIHAAGDNRIMSAAMHGGVARLEAMRGDFDRAWGLLADASRVLEDTTKAVSLIPRVMHGQAVAQVASLAGDYPRAESALRVTCRLLEEAGATGVLSTDLALLADALYAQGHDHEAEELTRTSERFTSQDDVMSQFQWRSVRAKLLARRGEVEEAQRLSAEAVDFARLTDAINLQADVWMARAEVLRRSGRATEAVRAAQQALDLYVRKDNLVSAGRARLFLADLSDVRVRAGG